MEQLIIFISTFLLVYLFYLIFVIPFNKKRQRLYKGVEATFIIRKYKVSNKTIENTKFCHLVAITNALIMATTVTIVSFINNYLFIMLAGLVILFPQIILYYYLIGKYYQKKEGKNND